MYRSTADGEEKEGGEEERENGQCWTGILRERQASPVSQGETGLTCCKAVLCLLDAKEEHWDTGKDSLLFRAAYRCCPRR